MVEKLGPYGVCSDPLTAAFRQVPRHRFVDAALADAAYELRSLPIGCGQTISSAATQARMTSLLEPRASDRVLEVGTGSGYQTAILAELVAWVFTIEMESALVAKARKLIEALRYTNVLFRVGDGVVGWREAAPFDGILVTAGAPQLPEGLLGQLAEGGRLICPVGSAELQELVVIRRQGAHFERQIHDRCRFVPLTGEEGWSDE